VKSEEDLRKEQALENLIKVQAEKVVAHGQTTIVDGEIVRGPTTISIPQPSSPFPGRGQRLRDGKVMETNPSTPSTRFPGSGQKSGEAADQEAPLTGPGMSSRDRARAIKAAIDSELDAAQQVAQTDKDSPFAGDLDPIRSEVAQLMGSNPDEFRSPNYENDQKKRIRSIRDCIAAYAPISVRSKQILDIPIVKAGKDQAPEAPRVKTLCTQGAADMRQTPEECQAIKVRVLAGLDQLAECAKTRAAIEQALSDATNLISQADPGSVFLDDVDRIRSDVSALIATGSEKVASPIFASTEVKRIGMLPVCTSAYRQIREQSKKTCKGIVMIRAEAPQIAATQGICDRALAALRAAPENCDATRAGALAEFGPLETAAKKDTITYWFNLLDKKWANAKKLPSDVENALGTLQTAEGKAATYSFEGLNQLLSAAVWPVARTSARGRGPVRPGKSGLPTVTRTAAGTAGLAIGRATVKGAKEAKSGDRQTGVAMLIRGAISNGRGGYDPNIFHWHILGDPQDNMVYHRDGTLLGFVDGHISKNTPQATQAANVERRYGEETVDIADDGGLVEIVEG
jgi:hypothetical protein